MSAERFVLWMRTFFASSERSRHPDCLDAKGLRDYVAAKAHISICPACQLEVKAIEAEEEYMEMME